MIRDIAGLVLAVAWAVLCAAVVVVALTMLFRVIDNLP